MAIITDVLPSGGVQMDLLFSGTVDSSSILQGITTTQLQSMLTGYTFCLIVSGDNEGATIEDFAYRGSGIVTASSILGVSGSLGVLDVRLIQISTNFVAANVYSPDYSPDTYANKVMVGHSTNISVNTIFIYGIKI